jgi:hypothetical protein
MELCMALASNSCPAHKTKIICKVKYATLGATPVLVFEKYLYRALR